jgi:asparagine synthase (glutamine-hydrolysing)
MCGIAGFSINGDQQVPRVKGADIISEMTKALAHRGPDAENNWNDDQVYLGHRRLSIIDLSESSNQPMHSSDDRYVIIYNGELYNYRELKLELQRVSQGGTDKPYFFKTNSDTEVVIAAYERWGMDCLQKFNGMYAFALYDKVEKKLVIVRDRLGIKPLYYSFKNGQLVFASEVRAILKSGFVSKTINKNSIADYFLYQTVQSPNTIIEDIKMLMPGHYMIYKNHELSMQRYWSCFDHSKQENKLNYKETTKRVNELLFHAVERRLIADVPFGAFLSGGIDSSAVVGIMSQISSQKINTFNVSFDESEFSEAKYAQKIANKFETNHHEIKLKPEDFLDQLPEALMALDHPSGDGPNTYIVSKATKNAGITMALSGLGGDELFAGYDVFKRMLEIDKKAYLNIFPTWMRKLPAAAIKAKRKSVAGDKIFEVLTQDSISIQLAYGITRKVFSDAQLKSVLNAVGQKNNLQDFINSVPTTNSQHKLSYVSELEIGSYMQNVLLRDTDQMSMAVALEVRVPFLDYKLVEYVLSINDEFKFPSSPKKLLIDSLNGLLPEEIINRPKMGFTLPWKHWLKNELRSFCETNLKLLAKRDFVRNEGLMQLWDSFLKDDKKVSWSRIWHLVVLEDWLQKNGVS